MSDMSKAFEEKYGRPIDPRSNSDAVFNAGWQAALATQPQAPQGAVTGWQPIETAPKDWTDIQLWARGVWYPECAWGMQTYPGNGERVTWVYQDDYDCNGPVFTKVIDPSHWMPPPAAPETPEGDKP